MQQHMGLPFKPLPVHWIIASPAASQLSTFLQIEVKLKSVKTQSMDTEYVGTMHCNVRMSFQGAIAGRRQSLLGYEVGTREQDIT